jgi:hypothetical protein
MTLYTWIYLVYIGIYLVYTGVYQYILVPTEYFYDVCQHAHIDYIKSVAHLTNTKDVFMCIMCFHARAGYLQTYETLLKENNLIRGLTTMNLMLSQPTSMMWTVLHWHTVI